VWFILLTSSNVLVFFFFFFQAEDGIRDFHVTGVQTCALPISRAEQEARQAARTAEDRLGRLQTEARGLAQLLVQGKREHPPALRSEERRVGKECRSRWSAEH